MFDWLSGMRLYRGLHRVMHGRHGELGALALPRGGDDIFLLGGTRLEGIIGSRRVDFRPERAK